MPKKNKSFFGVIGVLLVLFGIIFTIPLFLNKEYIGLIITALAVIAGVLLISWTFSN